MKITIEVHDQAVRAALARLRARVGDMRPVLLAIGEGMHARVDKRFTTQTDPAGRPWAPNRPATIKRKGAGKPILTDRRHLRQSIVPQVLAQTLVLSAAQPYAAIHQFGGVIERAAHSRQVRHRETASGDLLRRALGKGEGLVFAKDSHKRARTRWFEVAAYSVRIPARPYMPVRADGSLYPGEQAEVLRQIEAWLAKPG